MDPLIASRLNEKYGDKSNPHYDSALYGKISKQAKAYIDNGLSALNYVIPEWDGISDLLEMYQPVIDSQNWAKLDRNNPILFRGPQTLTQLWTLATFVAEILFGGEVARSVEAQDPNHDQSAESVNGLLAWNDAKNGIYFQGFMWCLACIAYNRGVWYESEDQDISYTEEEIEEEDFTQPKEHAKNSEGKLRYRNEEPVMAHPKRTRIRKKRIYSGFWNRLDLVSPYDFICDPTFPVCKFQEGRFAGHRVMISWNELDRRSKLDPSEDAYVLSYIVQKIKTQKGNTLTPAALGGTTGLNTTRTYYERTIRGTTASGIGGAGSGLVAGSDSVNKEDGGTVECFSITIRAMPKVLGLYPDDEVAELMTVLMCNTGDVLSINVRPNLHNQYPYAVGEARPNAHRQFSPSWGMACMPIQNRIDDLNNTHSKAQKRQGNILLVDTTKCNVDNLFSRDKDGLLIMRTAQGSGKPPEDLVYQIPLKDTTERFPEEAGMWGKIMEDTTGAHAQIQGQTTDPSQTATQNSNVQDMATGRISSIARLLSEQGVVPQTQRFVENFKQFMPDSMIIRIIGRGSEFDPDNPPQKFMDVKKADIQHGYDVIAHDGSLPGADAKVIAACARAIEVASANPFFAEAFDNKIPGALDAKRIMREMLKKGGLPIEKFSVTREQALQNLQQAQMASGQGIQANTMPPPQQAMSAPPPVDASGLPSAGQIPPIPSATPPQPGAELPQ